MSSPISMPSINPRSKRLKRMTQTTIQTTTQTTIAPPPTIRKGPARSLFCSQLTCPSKTPASSRAFRQAMRISRSITDAGNVSERAGELDDELTHWELCKSRSEEHTSELQSLRHLVCRL